MISCSCAAIASIPTDAQVIHRRAKTNRLGDRRCAGFEFVRELVGGERAQVDALDHIAAAQEGRHGFQQLLAPVQRADTGWTAHLVRGKSQKIHIQILHIHREMRHRLGPIHQGHCAGWCARRMISLAGLIVPSTLDMCVKETSFGSRARAAGGRRPDRAGHPRSPG